MLVTGNNSHIKDRRLLLLKLIGTIERKKYRGVMCEIPQLVTRAARTTIIMKTNIFGPKDIETRRNDDEEEDDMTLSTTQFVLRIISKCSRKIPRGCYKCTANTLKPCKFELVRRNKK